MTPIGTGAAYRLYPHMAWLGPIATYDVCHDCYMAHHYGAERVEREATEDEAARYHCGHDDRAIMGLEFVETDAGLQVVEWFAGESDQRCEGGEPLGELPDGLDVTDFTYDPSEIGRCEHCEADIRQTGYDTDLYDLDYAGIEWVHDDGRILCPGSIRAATPNTATLIGDGRTEFTWTSCDGCHSHLGGSRHRLAVHHPKETP